MLMHLEEGPLATALTPVEAGRHTVRLAGDDPELLESLWIERFEVRVAEPNAGRSDC